MILKLQAALVFSCSATFLVAGAVRAQTPTTERVSVDSAGAQANAECNNPAISASGRFVAFNSFASNLVASDTNASSDIFVRDRGFGAMERVSVSTSGVQANSSSYYPSISADGRFVAFRSAATNLVAGDTNGFQDVFVRDRTSGTTERVSIDTGGAEGNLISDDPSISADGRFVAFASDASNFVAGDTNGCADIFVRDRQSGTTVRVSVDSVGVQGNSSSYSAAISANGRFVAFESRASNLVSGDTNGALDVFLHDRISGTTERVSVDSTGMQGNQVNFGGSFPSISADGRLVAFTSLATNLVAGDTNGSADIFVRDRQSGTTVRVSVDSLGVQGNNTSDLASISSDGRFVAFESGSSNFVANDTNATNDVFVHERASGMVERVSIDSAGAEGNSSSVVSSISADGRFVAFNSVATNLVAPDTNFASDVFVRYRGPQPPHAYCAAGTTSHACSASISASANPSLSFANACNIMVANVEGRQSGILFYGIDNTVFPPGPWASGSTSLLCVKHPTQRTPIQNSGGTLNACNGAFVLDWNAYQTSNPLALGNPWSVGDKVFMQAWFRDPLAVKSTNLSNAVEMTYVP